MLNYGADMLPGFEAATIGLPPDYEGEVVATLVRRRKPGATRAALYIHGFVDYFFQTHVAEVLNDAGYDFYALDLRKYGRSLRDHQAPNFCRSLREYYPDIDVALEAMAADGHRRVAVFAHSTGGLLAALYARGGRYRDRIEALALNSPFLRFNQPAAVMRAAPAIAAAGRVRPYARIVRPYGPYPMSIHTDFHGEWDYDTRLKPHGGWGVRLGWLSAVYRAHGRVEQGLCNEVRTLVMHSARSIGGKEWHEGFMEADAVLDVEHMRELAPRLGANVTRMEFNGGMHDLTLSREPVRQRVLAELLEWLD